MQPDHDETARPQQAEPRSFSQEEINAEPTVTIEVPFSILESASVEMHFTKLTPSEPENYHSPNARIVLEYFAACVDRLEAEGVLVAEGGFWPTIRQEGTAFALPRMQRGQVRR